jgi:uncharacterized protein
MKCPQDVDVDLVMTERQGVEIDYCPSCRGVWLDRGELDKILDRAAGLAGPAAAPGPGQVPGHVSGHVPGEGGPGPAYGSGGYATGGGYGTGHAGGYDDDSLRAGGERRYDEDRRYGDDRHRYDDDRHRYADDRARSGRPGHDPHKKRKESWLGDLLDFG